MICDVYTVMGSSMEQKEATYFDGNKSLGPQRASVYRHPDNQREKIMWQDSPNFHFLQLKMLNILCGPHVLVCLTDNVAAYS